MYFRELPNPLLTYQLYEQFVNAVQVEEETKLIHIRDVVQQLPPPHYRTLEYLMRHLAKIASWGNQTGMTPKNVAIVWAPNLLRSKEMEGGCALHVVGVQAVLTEYLIRYVEIIFSGKLQSFQEQAGAPQRPRPKSLAISSPTKLLSLEEARTRALAANLPGAGQKYIDVGGGPKKLPAKYHTVIELPSNRRSGTKLKKSPSGWKSFFSRGWQSSSTREKDNCGRRGSLKLRKGSTGSLQHAQFPLQEKVITEADLINTRWKKLRTVKSAESLFSCTPGDSSCRSSSVFEPTGPTVSEASQSNLLNRELLSSSSQSLQKHVRSSSHDSYFDPSSKQESPPGDAAMDDQSLVQGSPQSVKKSPDSHESFTSFEHAFDNFVDSDTLASFSSSWMNFSQDETKNLSSEYLSNCNKVTRKQKLRSSDSDVSSPKVQKLSLRHFRQAFSSPSFSSRNETYKHSEWASFIDEKDQDALQGSFRRTKDKILHVLSPDSVQKKLFSLSDDKEVHLTNDKSQSAIVLYLYQPTLSLPRVLLESNLPSRQVRSLSDLRLCATTHSSDTLNTNHGGDTIPQAAKNLDIHTYDLWFHDGDIKTEDDCVKVVDEMLQAVAKKIEEETCGAGPDVDSVPAEKPPNCVSSSSDQKIKILGTQPEISTNCLTTTRDESHNHSGTKMFSVNKVCSFGSEAQKLNLSQCDEDTINISQCDDDSKVHMEETINTRKSLSQSDVMTSVKNDAFCAIKQQSKMKFLPQHAPFSKQQDTSREFSESSLAGQHSTLRCITEGFLIEDAENEICDDKRGNELNDSSKKYRGFSIEDDFNQGSRDVLLNITCNNKELKEKFCDPISSEQKQFNEKLNKSVITENGRLYSTFEKGGISDAGLKLCTLPESHNGKDAALVPASLEYPKFHRVCDKVNGKTFLDVTEENNKKTPLDCSTSSMCKSSQPSLFTQLKVLKLQAFHSPEMSKESIFYDPWSDPILDSVVDPQDIWEKQIFSSCPTHSLSKGEQQLQLSDVSKTEEINIKTTCGHKDQFIRQLSMDGSISKEEENIGTLPMTSTPTTLPAEHHKQSVKSPNMASVNSLISFEENERRERIDRYKEERRAQLRERWKSESFKKETPDKKHVGTRWRSSVPLSRTVTSLKDYESVKNRKEQSRSSGILNNFSLGENMKERYDDGSKYKRMERPTYQTKGKGGTICKGRQEHNTSRLTQLSDEINHSSDIVSRLSSQVNSDCGQDTTLYQNCVPNETLVLKHTNDYCTLRPETSV
ncbi:uncharacterized protein LOC143257430 [Tachypleus tridentatus]|uniref:uncharacterized protein LOC143257430 n=1 Tax=Tachypleus tridentatus TaxID=6853 RepID=UPI003FD1A582